MAKDNRRADRVAEAIREEVAMALIGGAKDPRIVGFVTVTGVDVTRDLRHAKVFVSVMGTVAEREQTLEGLAAIAPAIRTRHREGAHAALRAHDRVPQRPHHRARRAH